MSTLFQSVELAPRDPILGLNEQFNADPRSTKVNLGVGVYYDDNGKIPLLAAVHKAEVARVEAAAARGQGVTRIEVNGFTDRSGPADYNMQLSVRRANAVAAELVRRGVPRNEIVTRGFGEENNLVPTADGVREPQNRRVEIILK